jgi:chromosomal replication initiation ATPase DnaA
MTNDDIIKRVATLHNTTGKDIISKAKFHYIVKARRFTVFCVWALKPKMPLAIIGRIVNKEHTMVRDYLIMECERFGLVYPQDRDKAKEVVEGMLR